LVSKVAERAQMQHGRGRDPAVALGLRGRGDCKADGLHRAKAPAVLRQAVDVEDLVEADRDLLAAEGFLRAGAVGRLGRDLPFHHGLARQQLQLAHLRGARNIQHRGGRLLKVKGVLGRQQLVEAGSVFGPPDRRLLLLDAAVRGRGDDLLLQLGKHGGRDGKGAPHFHPALVDRPAVEVFRFAADRRRPGRILGRGQLQRLAERELLLCLAKPLPVFALIIHDAPQIAVQRQAAGLQLLLQDDRFHEALDDFEYLRQIIGDQDLGFDGDLRLYGEKASCRRKRIPEHFQFHICAPFA
jgi:hypothetical protein